ncbi:carbohydrate ABC transporter permease [Lacrimispora algidixylanolytica]|uniref:ABC transporter permease n=1 Tax=Lacrimispora algidixylanolytica TaxID=94868 RepID=A0A419SY78_9FIRM|nr:carbohydrate ABC transporter permease [Lacrimispora algidixylanolytica]RKD30207.1 ABC transporter permease [Lacrimispora algidixylanolytica]
MSDKEIQGKKNWFLSILSLFVMVLLLFPLYWIFVTSLKAEKEIFQIPPTLFPTQLNLDSYGAQLKNGDFNMFRSFYNSLIISVGSMMISVVLAVPASYGLARYRFKGRKLCTLGFLITQMLPVSVILTPMFIIFRDMRLLNNPLSAILADATIGIPFSVLILKNYFVSMPRELEEAAYIDGCNRFTAFIKILVPIAYPGVIVCGVFSFLYAWGDLAYGMTFIQNQSDRPITAGIFNFMGQYGTKWSYLTAFAVVTIIPVALVFIFMQKYIISGLTSGAVKG